MTCWSLITNHKSRGALWHLLVHIETRKHDERTGGAMSLETYVKQAIADVETELKKVEQCLLTHVTMPVSQGCCPKLDQLRELDSKEANIIKA
jgi:hypothetical protein